MRSFDKSDTSQCTCEYTLIRSLASKKFKTKDETGLKKEQFILRRQCGVEIRVRKGRGLRRGVREVQYEEIMRERS